MVRGRAATLSRSEREHLLRAAPVVKVFVVSYKSTVARWGECNGVLCFTFPSTKRVVERFICACCLDHVMLRSRTYVALANQTGRVFRNGCKLCKTRSKVIHQYRLPEQAATVLLSKFVSWGGVFSHGVCLRKMTTRYRPSTQLTFPRKPIHALLLVFGHSCSLLFFFTSGFFVFVVHGLLRRFLPLAFSNPSVHLVMRLFRLTVFRLFAKGVRDSKTGCNDQDCLQRHGVPELPSRP